MKEQPFLQPAITGDQPGSGASQLVAGCTAIVCNDDDAPGGLSSPDALALAVALINRVGLRYLTAHLSSTATSATV